ncbi:MAG: MoxR family ATPase [Lachnospiraceae bacterium]|nr:MoxR family ATPase [Lachnospiraceae bacterium]
MEQEKLLQVQEEVNRVIQGKEDVVKKVFAAMIAGGHILMEDIPGVGKTTLATTFARTLALKYHRVQFTPDVLPSDILGFSMYQSNTGEFEFRPGSVFCNLFLADEINRTSPKTQSALLEVMEERQASVEGKTWNLPDPFFVIATQNPSGSSGTQLLPESQLDRFMICLSMGYPSHSDAVAILKGEVWKKAEQREQILTAEELKELQQEAAQIYVHDAIYDYIVTLVEETRRSDFFAEGASPRASIALLKMSRSMARLEGRDFVTAGDVQSVLRDVLGHRIKVSARARSEGMDAQSCIDELLLLVKSPRS